MSNPLMGMMGGMPGGNGPFGMIQRMMGMMQNTQNPGAMLQNMAQSNPNIKKATDDCKSETVATILFFRVLRKMERSTVLRHTRKCRYRDIKRGRRKVQIS